jgi:pimeloyl-ACP methyl ester carboxylesterase
MVWIYFLPLFVLFLALLALGFWISSLLLYPKRQPLTKTPLHCGMQYEDVAFHSSDGLALKGWWIPSGQVPRPEVHHRAVILLHPMFGNREGFSARDQTRRLQLWQRKFQADLDLLKIARQFHNTGYSVLMFDFRCHGESQRGRCAGGLAEDQDVAGAVDYVFNRITAEAMDEKPRVGILGFGLGAAAAIAAIGREKGGAEPIRVFSGDSEGGSGWQEFQPANVKKLRFLIAVQPASLGVMVRGSLRRVSAALSLVLVPIVNRLYRWRGGYALDGSILHKFVRDVNLPVLFIQTRADPWDGYGEVQRLYDAAPGPKEIWWIEALHGLVGPYETLGDHPERMLAFADQSMSATRLPKS